MKWMLVRKRLTALAVIAASAAVWAGVGGGTGAGAYVRWALLPCHGSPDKLLLEDIPGGSADDEVALFIVSNGTDLDESCTWRGTVPIVTATYNASLVAHAAVNDNTQLTVGVYDINNALVGETSAFTANSDFQVITVPLPNGRSVASVRVSVTDLTPGVINPNQSVPSGRSSAAVTFLGFSNNGQKVWVEPFTAAG